MYLGKDFAKRLIMFDRKKKKYYQRKQLAKTIKNKLIEQG